MRRVLLLFVVGVIAVVFFGGCATSQSGPNYFLKTDSDAIVFVDAAAPAMRKIALMSFKAPTELIGSSVSELFVTEILKAERYTLVERSQIKQVLGETEMAMSGMTSAKAAEVGALVGADGVIIGTVDQYESKAVKGHTFPVVGITFRLIDCKSGKIAWSVDLAKRADNKKATLSTHGRFVVHEMMSGLYKELIKYEPPEDVSGLKVSELGLRSATITWNKSSGRGVICIVERSEKNDGPFEEIARIPASQCAYTDNGLKDSTTYYYKVTAQAKNGVKSRTAGPVETFTAPPPTPPIGVKAESEFVKSVPVSWMKPKETMYVSGYILRRSESKGGPFVTVKEVQGANTLSYCDGGSEPGSLKDDTEYFYEVITVNEAGAQSQPATVVKAKTRGIPPVVRSVMALSSKPREIPVAWEPSEDEKVAGYIISRLDEATGDFAEVKRISGRAVDTWVDRGGEKKNDRIGELQDGTSHKYQVAAYNIGNTQSAWSEVVSAMTKKSPAKPSMPECVNGLVGVVDLEWETNREKDIENYVISCSETKDGRYKECGRTGECSFKHSGRDNGTEYFYKVKAIDSDTLESEWSESGSATTKPCPDAPTGLSSEGNSDGYLVKWTPPAQNDVTSYAVHKKSLFGKSSIGFSNKPEFLLTSEDVGKSIEIYVTAKDKDGLESGFSESCVIIPAQ